MDELDFNSSDDELTEMGRQAIEDLLFEDWNSEEMEGILDGLLL